MLSKYAWDNIAKENYLRSVDLEHTYILSLEKRLFEICLVACFLTWCAISPNNLGSFCSVLAREFIYGLRDNNEQGPTLTGTCQCFHYGFINITGFYIKFKGIMNSKNNFFNVKQKFDIFCRKSKKLDAVNTRIFSLTFLLFLETIFVVTQLPRHYDNVTKK